MSKAIQGVAEIAGAVAFFAAAAFIPGAGFLIDSVLIDDLVAGVGLAGVSMEAGAIADALTQNRGIGITTRQPASYRQVIYGTQRVGGIIVYESTTGSHYDQYNYVIVIAGHVCDSIEALYLDGRKVHFTSGSGGNTTRNGVNFGGSADSNDYIGAGGVHYNFGSLVYCEARYGEQSDGDVISGLTANDPNWASSSSGSPYLGGCTYVYLKIEYDANMFPSLPEIRFTVNGKNDIYDPRTGNVGFSTNWALVTADVIADTTFGLGDDSINEDQLIAAANVCDEQVDVAATGSTEARYSCHWHYDCGTAPGDVLQTMMNAAVGKISRIGGQWNIFPAYWTGPSLTFYESDFTGRIDWSPTRKTRELYNRINGTYIAANYPYNTAGNLYDSNGWYDGTLANTFPLAFQPTNYPQYACDELHGYGTGVDVYLTEDGGIPLPGELTQSCVLSITQAQRCAKIYMLRNRRQGTATLPMGLTAMQVQPFDVVEINFDALNWVDKQLQVTGTTLSCALDDNDVPRLRYQLQVQESDSSVYEWDTGEELTQYDVPANPTANAPYIVEAPTNLAIEDDTTTQMVLQDGTVMDRVLVTWTPPDDTYVANGGSIQIQYSLATNTGKPEPEILNPVHNPDDNTYTTGWLDAGSYPGIATSCFIDSINIQQYQNITVQVRAVRSNGASSDWVAVNNHGLNTSQPSFPIGADGGPIFTFANSGVTLETLEAVASVSAATVLTATGQQKNLVPDSDLKFTSAYWVVNTSIPVASAIGADGANGFEYTGTGNASGYLYNRSAAIPVIQNQAYTLSGYIDATAVTAGDDPYWGVYTANIATLIGGQVQTAGHVGRVSLTFTVPTGITQVRFVCDTADCTVTSGSKLIFSNPQLELGSVMTSYKSNTADDTTGYILHGAMSTEVQTAIQSSTGQVLNLGGIAAGNITPISTLMPAQANADVTAQAGFVTILNPKFQNGSTNWSLQTGWTMAAADSNSNAIGSSGFVQFSASATAAVVNLSKVPCQAGDVLSVSAMSVISTKPTGAVYVRINFYNSSGTLLSTVNGNDISGSTLNSVAYSRCSSSAPTNTGYARFDFAVFTSATAVVNVYAMTAALSPRSLDEVPDGSTYQRPLYITSGVYKTSQGLVPQGSLTNISEGSDGSVLSYTSNNTSIVMSWASFYIFAPDGNVYTVSAGGKTFSSLTASKLYYFCAWYVISTNTLSVVSSGTAAATEQYQVQTVQGDGNVGVCINFTCSTTGSSGQSGGTGPGGGGGSCFSPTTLVLVQQDQDGVETTMPIAAVTQGCLVKTLAGTWRKVFYVSTTDYKGVMQIIPDVGLATPHHQMWDGAKWVNADQLYPDGIVYEGTIHNLHIDTDTDDEHSYTLANGQVVHNLFTNPD